jgi:outer membrane protein insertion porin family
MRAAATGLWIVLFAASGAPAAAQAPPAPSPPAQPAAVLPPEGSGPLLRFIELRFHPENVSVIDPNTYLYYIQTQTSRPSAGVWVPYDERAEESLIEDFRRLWNTKFLDNLWIEVQDAPWPNGVVGKHVIFHMEERQRVKIVDYTGSGADKLDRTKIDEKLKEKNAIIRLDSFIDEAQVRRVEGILREMLAEKGYHFGQVRHQIQQVAGGPKLVHLTFHIDEGPQIKIRRIDFVGNRAIGDGSLQRKMKENKAQWFLSFLTGRGTYREDKFAEDAEKIIEYYREKGYIMARVGQPEMTFLEDSEDGKTRWVELRIPVTEGERYRISSFGFDGNKVVKTEALQELFKKLKPGTHYNEKHIRKGLEKARELYGSLGYFEFTAFPDLRPRPAAAADTADGARGAPAAGRLPGPLVDVTMRVQEGKQYFVNRITFVGNHTTRDSVIRRELRLYENGVFNTEALKFSIRRLNQLGYFKQLEGDAVQVDKAPGTDNKVNVTLKLEEQNRNQLTFGAGVSQFEGFFGQLSFQTANFMGRGETLTVSAQSGSRAQNYQLAFTEPFLFDRPITGGIDLFKRDIRFINQFTQKSVGGNLIFGFPVADFTRMFLNYSYERVRVTEINQLFCDPEVLNRNIFLRDALLLGGAGCEGLVGQRTDIDPFTGLQFTTPTVSGTGRRTISKITPSLVHNTVDNPIFPNTGRRYTLAIELAGLGGNTSFYKPRAEGVWFFQHTRRTSLGLRAAAEYIRPFGATTELPIFERLFLGGEYSVRGFEIRSIGPQDPVTGLVVGGNKSLLFNAEYLITIAGPVRLVLFYDAGQVRNQGERFAFDAFKTSTGAEVRFFMPVLNVPFRLIFAYNPQREGVLDASLRPQQPFAFRFAVGSTF